MGYVREEQRPASISPEGFQAHQRRISLVSPELAGAMKPDLILFAGEFPGPAAQRLPMFLGSFVVEPLPIVFYSVGNDQHVLGLAQPMAARLRETN